MVEVAQDLKEPQWDGPADSQLPSGARSALVRAAAPVVC